MRNFALLTTLMCLAFAATDVAILRGLMPFNLTGIVALGFILAQVQLTAAAVAMSRSWLLPKIGVFAVVISTFAATLPRGGYYPVFFQWWCLLWLGALSLMLLCAASRFFGFELLLRKELENENKSETAARCQFSLGLLFFLMLLVAVTLGLFRAVEIPLSDRIYRELVVAFIVGGAVSAVAMCLPLVRVHMVIKLVIMVAWCVLAMIWFPRQWWLDFTVALSSQWITCFVAALVLRIGGLELARASRESKSSPPRDSALRVYSASP